MRQHWRTALSLLLLALLAGMTAPIPSRDQSVYLALFRIASFVMLFLLLIHVLQFKFAVGAEAPGMTDSGEEGVGFWTRERKGLSLLLFLGLVTYAYTRLAEVSLPGIVVISVCLVLLNVGILVWFAYHWRRRLS